MRLLDVARRSPATRTGLSISVATGLYGVSFGALGVVAGLDVAQTVVLSLLMFSGGSQFALVGVVAGGGTPASALGAAALLGLRNGVYGAQVNAMLRPRGWRRYAVAQVTIDESTATALAQPDRDEQRRGFLTAGLGVFVLWNLFTLLGALLGDALGDPTRWGLGRRRGRRLPGPAVAAPDRRRRGGRSRGSVRWSPSRWSRCSRRGVPILAAAVVAAGIGWFR